MLSQAAVVLLLTDTNVSDDDWQPRRSSSPMESAGSRAPEPSWEQDVDVAHCVDEVQQPVRPQGRH